MNQKFVSKSNFVLRKVLNSDKNLDIIKDFLESILNIKIISIRLNPYLKSKEKCLPEEENFGIADVRVKTDLKEEYNIGIQFVDGIYVQNKIFLYYAQIHSNQLEYFNNTKIVKTITINILDYEYFEDLQYHKKILIQDKKESKEGEIELHIIELPKFEVSNLEKLTYEEEWLLYFKERNSKNIKSIINRSLYIKKLDILLDEFWRREKME